jgi:DNA polymerase I-like protein with 3'-5' exonuclease and polymerase domains
MSGKKPYYDETGLLIIDDIYLMGASKQPDLKDGLRKAYDEGGFDKWLEDPELVQKKHPIISKVRKKAKPRILGIGYGMGAKEMVRQALDNGDDLSIKDADGSVKAYWEETFKELNKLRSKLTRIYTSQGYLVNRFGFMIRPDSSHKCLNYWIQSTINGEMDVLLEMVSSEFERRTSEEAMIDGIIHDELLFQCRDDLLPTLKSGMEYATDMLNKIVQWDVQIKTGWVTGKTLYEAK